jgi:hypothetical protein
LVLCKSPILRVYCGYAPFSIDTNNLDFIMGGPFAFFVLLIVASLSLSGVAGHPNPLHTLLRGRGHVEKPLLRISKHPPYKYLRALRIDLLILCDSATRDLDHARIGRRHCPKLTEQIPEAFA